MISGRRVWTKMSGRFSPGPPTWALFMLNQIGEKTHLQVSVSRLYLQSRRGGSRLCLYTQFMGDGS